MLWKEGRNNVPHSPRKKLRACVAVAPTRSHRVIAAHAPSVAQRRRRRAPRTVARRIVDLYVTCIALAASSVRIAISAPPSPPAPLPAASPGGRSSVCSVPFRWGVRAFRSPYIRKGREEVTGGISCALGTSRYRNREEKKSRE